MPDIKRIMDLNKNFFSHCHSGDDYNFQDEVTIYRAPFLVALKSKVFSLPEGYHQIRLTVDVLEGGISFCLLRGTLLRRSKTVASRVVKGGWKTTVTLYNRVKKKSKFKIILANYNNNFGLKTRFRVLDLTISSLDVPRKYAAPATELTHWTVFQKMIHRFCRGSKKINTMVAAVEMRMGKEELLSLPQYMGLCPTGICNASCLFCSVTKNRSGIQKGELPYDRLAQFLGPVYKTIRTFGLEGNGEPTLYSRFNDLIKTLTADKANCYLITNGECLTADQIDLLLAAGVTSVNFSVNAASSETHFQVMKLKGFEKIINNIRMFSAWREDDGTPDISICFVVNHLNIHEVVDFLAMGLDLLCNKNDRIYIRPLSELANDAGSIEDTRGIVPFESDIRDMIDGVNAYLKSHPSDIGVSFDPDSFKSFRPDPPGKVVVPPGYERQILPPREKDWQILHGDVKWSMTGFSVNAYDLSGALMIMESCLVPVEPNSSWQCNIFAKVSFGDVQFFVLTEGGEELASLSINEGEESKWVALSVETSENDMVCLSLKSLTESLVADFEFKRFRSPAHRIVKGFVVPESQRWQVDSPGVIVEWYGKELNLQWHGANSVYLIKSYMIPCLKADQISVPVEVNVSSGVLAIGILSEDSQSWIDQFFFEMGKTKMDLDFNSLSNNGLYIVLFAMQDGLLHVKINWSPGKIATREIDRNPSKKIALSATNFREKHEEKDCPAPKPVKYYCQKPWTDLNNFTVDGRMDVCCIATGPTQERYTLGSIYDDNFQEIWNGEQMREFRRTVNSNQKLPPCQRCPMAYAYQGPFFSPRVNHPFKRRSVEKFFITIGLGKIHSKISSLIDDMLYMIFFQGFKR